MSIKYIKGDLIKMAQAGEFDIIMHGCNCHKTMGAGIAKTIKAIFPAAYAADLAYGTIPLNMLGEYSVGTAVLDNDKRLDIVNLYTQYGLGARAEYSALRQALQLFIGERFITNEKIGIPWIGAGIGGLTIDLVQQIVEEEMGHLDVTMVEWK